MSPLSLCGLLWVTVLGALLLVCPGVHGMGIDKIISEAANSTKEFEFAYDLGNNDVRYELDMIFSWEDWNRDHGTGRTKRQAVKAGVGGNRWTNRVVPYQIAGGTFSSSEQNEIQSAMNDWSRYTCLSFPRAKYSDRNRISFQNGGGCYSRVGMTGGSQEIGLARGCRIKHIIIHEIGHALGLHHEQTRPDRDSYVTINSRNVASNMLYNFKKYTWRTIQDYRVPYNYYSIMHYSKTAFAVNGGITIQTKNSRYLNIIGNQKGLSFRDIKTMNLMYPCPQSGCSKSHSDCPGEGFVGKDCKCWCPGSPYKICDGTETGGGGGGDGGGGGGGGDCQDQNSHCRTWASQGECNKNPSYMNNYCKKSCNKCDGGGGGGGEGSSCRDLHGYCSTWARSGYCSHSFTVFMRSNCRRSCNLCASRSRSTTSRSCRDLDHTGNCESWANMGECENNPNYMRPYCKKSCGLCAETMLT